MPDNLVGRNIAGARYLCGWDQAELAQAVTDQGVYMSPRTLGRIERGERDARAGEVQTIAAVLRVPVGWFYIGPDWLASAEMRGWLTSDLDVAA